MFKTLAILAATATLAACVSPTAYRAAGADGIRFGYTSSKLTDQLHRVRFQGTGRTPLRWIDAFLLYRAAEVAKEANAPAFRIVEGTVDTSVLTGDDVFGRADTDLDADVRVTLAMRQADANSDTVIGHRELESGMRRTAGSMPIFHMPPPPLPKYQPPVYIYTPGYAAPPLPDRTILVELRPDLQGMDDKTFATADVLDKLGPRIKRAAPKDPAPKIAPPTAS